MITRIMKVRLQAIMLALFLSLGMMAHAGGLAFSQHYSANMILQREKPLLIRGFADSGVKVAVQFAGQTKATKADEKGGWSVTLDPLSANSKGTELTAASDGKTVTLGNVLVGDVFFFARQATIDISLGRDEAGQKRAATIPDTPHVRVLSIETIAAMEPQQDLAREATEGWMLLNKTTALKMSGAAFYLASQLAKDSSVPVGMIDLNMSYYFPIAWMSRDALEKSSSIYGEKSPVDGTLASMDKDVLDYKEKTSQKALDALYEKAVADATRKGAPIPEKPADIPEPILDPRFPAAGYNAVLYPMRGMALKGLLLQLGNDYPYIHYQDLVHKGENTKRGRLGQAYKSTYDLRKWGIKLEPYTTPHVPFEWRSVFADHSLPIGLITPPGSDLVTMGRHHDEMRELQRHVAEKSKGVDLILSGTEHIPLSAQPADEALLASRCLNWVQGAIYQKQGVVPSGPLFDRFIPHYTKGQIFFKPGTAQGLKAGPGALDHFEVAGADQVFYPAPASIDGSTVRVTTDKIGRIVYARYNWTERPNQGLINNANLPAVPFRTDEHTYPGVIDTSGEELLPEEFSTPASQWQSGVAVIVNGGLDKRIQFNTGRSLGATGLKVGLFGPNLYVNYALKGSPADGRIFTGDLIYQVNGELFGSDPLDDVGKAITYAESEAGEGRISFGLKREEELLTVELKLEVLGTYSSTSPYECAKSDRIVANAEAFLAKQGGVMAKSPSGVYKTVDALFMLAAGSPEYQGLVRRFAYKMMSNFDPSERIDPVTKKGLTQAWYYAYPALFLGEYYLATGDRSVLPYIQYYCDGLDATQLKHDTQPSPWPDALVGQAGGWRHNLYGGRGYGTMPAIGVPATLAFHYAKEAGVEYDYSAYERAVNWFRHNGVEVGYVGYGFSSEPKTTPDPIDHDKMKEGRLTTNNGAIGGGAVLFNVIGDRRTAERCSFISTYSYHNTHAGHGGNFWNNWWTPLGAQVQGKRAFQIFMKGNRSYLDLQRMYTHGRDQGSGGIGGGQFMSLVAPRKRLRMLGAPESVFAANPDESLRPALSQYHQRHYKACEETITALIDSGKLLGSDLEKAQQLKAAAQLIQQSISEDLRRVKRLTAEGKLYEASLDLPQLQGVIPPGNADVTVLAAKLDDPAMKEALAADQKRYKAYLDSLNFDHLIPKEVGEDNRPWQSLITLSNEGSAFKDAQVADDAATKWKLKIVESIERAPKGWNTNTYDDSDWTQTTLPISWHLNHTALLRAPFEIKDRKAVKALRLRNWAFRQQNMLIYINGTPVAKISNAQASSVLTIPLNEAALKHLKNGRNTIAATYKNNWRWGRYTRPIELAGSGSVYNSGVSLVLDMLYSDPR